MNSPKIIIHELRLSELERFVRSERYRLMSDLPISPHRALSYVRNQRAEPDDVVLLMLFVEEQLVAYRSLFPDKIFYDNKNLKFAWISGSWVAPNHRRKGFSKLLLQRAFELWDNNLMFSNYAPESHDLYLKSGKFSQVYKTSGYWYYFRFETAELLKNKHRIFQNINPLLKVFDAFGNIFADLKLNLLKSKSFGFKITDFEDVALRNFIDKQNKSNPFRRGAAELLYILKNPWVLQNQKQEKPATDYFFSAYSDRFFYKILKFSENNEIQAFMLLKVRNKALTVAYVYFETGYENQIIEAIFFYIKKLKISYFVISHPLLAETFALRYKFAFLHKKTYIKDFYASGVIGEILKNGNFLFQDGDGDGIFT